MPMTEYPTIADILRSPGPFSGLFRVHDFQFRPRPGNRPYCCMEITDATGKMTCYGWPQHFVPTHNFLRETIVEIAGQARQFNNRVVADILTVTPADHLLTASLAVQLLPYGDCPVPAMLLHLLAIERSIMSPALRFFVGEVMMDRRVAVPFISVPASLKHHHQQPGGLLTHSVNVVEIIQGIPGLTATQREICVVGGLLHDVGKTRTNQDGKITLTGKLISHDSLTLEICGAALQTLDRTWGEAALTLRHIWTCASPGARYGEPPATVLAEVVRFADHFSAELDKERQAFKAANGPTLERRIDKRHWEPGQEPQSKILAKAGDLHGA
jgi:3'-5' exoribonuclease